MSDIPYPNVPLYPGVPALLRPVQVVIAGTPALAIGIGTFENILSSAVQQSPRWGIFDADGNQLGIDEDADPSIVSALSSQVTGDNGPVLSTFGVEFMREMRISDFPIEAGSFANYNKVKMPANPVVTLALAGDEGDRSTFLNALDEAVSSTDLYSVVTPEVTYANYSLERYRYSRRASQGATLLIVEISLKEIRTVTSSYTTVTTAPIVNPQNAGSAAPESNGMTQPTPPETSTLLSLAKKLGVQ